MSRFVVIFNRNGVKIRLATKSEKIALGFVAVGWYLLIHWLGLLLLAH